MLCDLLHRVAQRRLLLLAAPQPGALGRADEVANVELAVLLAHAAAALHNRTARLPLKRELGHALKALDALRALK